MRILFGNPITYDEDGKVKRIEPLIYVKDHDNREHIFIAVMFRSYSSALEFSAGIRPIVEKVRYDLVRIDDEGMAIYEHNKAGT